LPPHVWHEVAFTRIAGIYGHVIFPEKCNKNNNNNLVFGKVCILTKNMDLIQHNMPIIIDEVHFCVRIQEIQGECDEIFLVENSESYELDDDRTTVQDEQGDSNDENNEEDDDEYLDDVDLMLDNEHGVIGDLSGGWIRNESPLKNASPRSSEFDNIQQPPYLGSPKNSPEYSKILLTLESQKDTTGSSTSGNGHEVQKDNILVPHTLFEENSPLELQTTEMEKTRDVAFDSDGAYVTSRDQRYGLCLNALFCVYLP
nr:RNA-directed DNA polymerase, eukaryota [Tanacetum cinerariifolium]